MPMPTAHPGKLLLLELLERDWTLSGLAKDLGLDRGDLRDILECFEPVTPDIAAKIGEVTDTCAEFWLLMQKNYDAAQEVVATPKDG